MMMMMISQKCCIIDVGKSTAADAQYPCRLGNEGLTTSENVRDGKICACLERKRLS